LGIDLTKLAPRLEGVMLEDLPALRAALGNLSHSSPASVVDAFIQRLERSEKRVAARRSLAPTPRFDQELPVIARRREIADAIRDHQVVILCGETGSGKTTQLPQICLSLGRGVRGLIGHTQPRRLAARAVATRIAAELSTPLGRQVGFKVRFGDQTSGETMIKLMTDGILLAEATGGAGSADGTGGGRDQDLLRYDTIIIDEAHERSLNIDFLLGYLKRLLPRRPDLKVIVTSATIDPARFSDHFGGPTVAPVLMVSGRTFPVEMRYSPVSDRDEITGEVDNQAIVDAAHELCSPRLVEGDILVFLPGEREIRDAEAALRRDGPSGAEILPLYSRLTEQEQDRVFKPSAPGRRKIVLATNVAETSLTVPGIRYVIDAGLVRLARYDPRKKVQRLPIEMVSQASANQRSGRCGRVAAGVCIRLYSEAAFNAQPVFTDPEIRRTDLSAVILRAKAMDLGPVNEFPFLDMPSATAIRDGCETLFELGALETKYPDGEITPVGRSLAQLPVDPRVGRMLIGGRDFRCMPEMLVLAGALETQDPLQRPAGRETAADIAHSAFKSEKSDFITLLNLWRMFDMEVRRGRESSAQAWCREQFVSAARMREWIETAEQLRDAAIDAGLADERSADVRAVGEADEASVHKALLTGLITSVCCRDDAGGGYEYNGIRGNKCSIFPGSCLFKKRPKWFVASEIVQTTKLYARTLGPIEPAWLEDAAPHMLTREVEGPHLDEVTGEPSCFERLTLTGLTVVPRRKASLSSADPVLARRVLIDRLLIGNEYPSAATFTHHNAKVLALAIECGAKLRLTEPPIDHARLREHFEKLIPASVVSRSRLDVWRHEAERREPRVLFLSQNIVLKPEALDALDQSRFPTSLTITRASGEAASCPISYRMASGKDTDGATVRVLLTDLPRIDADRTPWGVPGWLGEKVASLIKQLPKAERAKIEAVALATAKTTDTKLALAAISEQIAGLMEFGKGPLAAALSETLDIAFGVTIAPAAWPLDAAPDYLTLRVEAIEPPKPGAPSAEPTVCGAGRDVTELRTRLGPRIERALAAQARDRFARVAITSWDFGPLAPSIEQEDGTTAFTAIIDNRSSVALSLMEEQRYAEGCTRAGVRRLFVLAAKDELEQRSLALPNLSDLERWYTASPPLGSAKDLHDALCCITCERVFMFGQPPIRDRDAFDERLQQQWGRLGQTLIDTSSFVGKVLEPRFLVAKRLSTGTNRLWAASIADIREHAAYLMPPGFLHLTPWDRLQRYPLYAQAMRQRLLNLREDGSGAETQLLATINPWHKRLTAWVSRAITAERQRAQAAGGPGGGGAGVGVGAGGKARGGGAMPLSRRAAPTVNADAGLWALQPGALPAEMEVFRWAVEEFRLAVFSPPGSPAPPGSSSPDAAAAKDTKRLETLAKAAEAVDPAQR
jgi:ATP-dependent helicase HrpA